MTSKQFAYRKKPVTIEAFRYGPDVPISQTPNWFIAACDSKTCVLERDQTVSILTLEGWMTGKVGDWIIRGVKGELYPCKPDIFEVTYERA